MSEDDKPKKVNRNLKTLVNLIKNDKTFPYKDDNDEFKIKKSKSKTKKVKTKIKKHK